VKWAAYHKLQAKPPKGGANALEEDGKSEVELSKDAATEATAEWTNFVRVSLHYIYVHMSISLSLSLSLCCLGIVVMD
jgi:hypothetical protein